MNIKQYLKTIEGFFKNHRQINTVFTGSKFDFNADSKILYRVAHIEYIGLRTTDIEKTFSFFITIADIYDVNNPDSEYDIYSDCSQIAEDTLDYFSNTIQSDYVLEETAAIDPIDNGHKDRVRGAVFTLSFTETRTSNNCILPLKN